MILLAILLTVPPEIDIDHYLPPPSIPLRCADDMESYPIRLLPIHSPHWVQVHDQSGELVRFQLRPGYLLSECELLNITNIKMAESRMRTELTALRALRTREFELWRIGETQYQQAIQHLEAQLRETQGWWERNQFLIGMVVGMVTVATTTVGMGLLLD